MKTSKTALILAATLVALVIVDIVQASTIWIGSYVTVAGTTYNSPTNSLTTLTANPGIFICSDSTNLISTNDVTFKDQWSLDNTNFYTATSFTFPSTTAGSYQWTPGPVSLPVYHRIAVQSTTTNGYNVYQP